METVNGRLRGFWVTCYSIEVSRGRYAAYAKVCSQPPADYWNARPIFKLFGGEDHPSAAEAVDSAFAAASRQISLLPARDMSGMGFTMFDEARNVVFPLAPQIQQRFG